MNKKINLLVVDDSRTVLKMLKQQLTSYNCNISLASNGLEAMTLLPRVQPALILCDCFMPLLDGFKTCFMIKNSKNYSHVPVVIVSGNNDYWIRSKAKVMGAMAVLTKPVMQQEFEKILEAIK